MSTEPQPIKPLPLISFGSIMRDPILPIEWDIEPLIARGDRVLLYAEWGTFKTWLALSIGLSIAAGLNWLGKFPGSQPRRVLYLDEEMNPRTLRRRIKRLGLGMGLLGQDIPFRALSRHGVRFDAEGAQKLALALNASEFIPEVIIVDTFRRVSPGNENETKDVTEFWLHVEPFLRHGVTLIVLHHMRKPKSKNEHGRHRASGSTDMMAGVDAALALERREKDKDMVAVEVIKTRDAVEAEKFCVRLADDGTQNGPINLEYAGTENKFKAEGRAADRAIPLLLEVVTGPTPTRDIIAALGAKGISPTTVERAIRAAAKARQLRRPEGAGQGVWEQAAPSEPSSVSVRHIEVQGTDGTSAVPHAPQHPVPSVRGSVKCRADGRKLTPPTGASLAGQLRAYGLDPEATA